MKYILLGVQVLPCHFFETDSLFKHFTLKKINNDDDDSVMH